MPKNPPYYARITFRATVTKFLASSDNIQVDYDYAIGQQAMRHYGTFRIHGDMSSAGVDGLLHGNEAMVRKHLGDIFPRPMKDADVYLSLVADDPDTD